MTEKTRILIVDDNLSQSRTMSHILAYKGYAVTTAYDGPEAIERVKERAFDIIFMDIKMPLMDGIETYKHIKKIRPNAMVMMMTAYALEELVQEALEEGALGVLYKPVDIEKVLAAISEAKEARKGALILIVDDDPGICTTMSNILVEKGHNVGVASNGDDAIAMVQVKIYDIIFIDMVLPTINGLETFLALKEISPEIIAIMITAFRAEVADLVEEALRNNAYTCLYKPLDMDKLLQIVERIIDEKRNL